MVGRKFACCAALICTCAAFTMADTLADAASDADPAILSVKAQIAEQQKKGGSSLQIAALYESIAERQRQKGNWNDAAKTYENVVSLRVKAAANPILLAHTYEKMARYLQATRQLERAEEYKKRELAVWEKEPGPHNQHLISGLDSIAMFYQATDKFAKAIPYLERLVPLQLERNPKDSSRIEQLAAMYVLTKEYAKAETMLEKVYATRSQGVSLREPKVIPYDLIPIAERLAEVETKLNKLAEAEAHLNIAKSYYEQIKRPGMFDEVYGERFLAVYTEYLHKSGKLIEHAIYSARLSALRTKREHDCAGCGRG
jgi:tetratricopeptide (TPR) repeat protein